MKELLNYNSKTGEFHWKETGRKAGYVDNRGFRKIESKGKVVRAHQLAWEMYYGEPVGEVYHINGNTDDNRIENLAVIKDFEKITDVLRYDPDTGKLFWTVSPSRKVKIGSEAGCQCKTNKLVQVLYRGKQYRAHRLAWEIYYGSEPDGEIDHINGNPADNRIQNLRCVSHGENQRNMKVSKRSKTGIPGVRQTKSGKYQVTVQDQRIGTFDDLNTAVQMRQMFEEIEGFHENHGKR